MKRSKHNLSHYVQQSMNMGYLTPCAVVEVVHGDTFRHHVNTLLRLAPLNTPVMHPVKVVQHCWFVPNRLLWDGASKTDNWNAFITGGMDGENAAVMPTIAVPSGGFPQGSLMNYLKVPAGRNSGPVNALAVRAYNLIFNHYYRDEQLMPERVVSLNGGLDSTTDLTLARVAWGNDPFTSSRPEPQLGADVYLPLGTSAPVKGIGLNAAATSAASPTLRESGSSATLTYPFGAATSAAGNVFVKANQAGINATPQIFADLTAATAVTVNALRQASAIQRFEERMNRFGARIDEYLLSDGVRPSDARLQLPEYLGGVTQTVQFSEVLGTTDTNLGALGGHGIASLGSGSYERFFEEDGIMMCLMYVLPVTTYADGLHAMYTRRTKFDYWNRQLETIGDEPVRNSEVFIDGTSADADPFGWRPRYDTFRRIPSWTAGEFTGVLDTWNMTRLFNTRPALNADFVTANPTDRIFQSSEDDTLYVYQKHHIVARRLVSKYAKSVLK